MRRRTTFADLTERFQVQPNSCWHWVGTKTKDGYGTVSMKGRTFTAHRLIHLILVGPIEKGLDLDHLCQVKHCCNPFHMEAVTRKQNLSRRYGGIGWLPKPFCPKGHKRQPDWGVECKVCRVGVNAAYRAKKKGILRDNASASEQ